MTKQKIEIEIDVPEGYEFVRFKEGIVITSNASIPAFYPTFEEVTPAHQIIDLSCIVGSGIDCEFSSNQFNQGMFSISPLRERHVDRTDYDYAERTTGEWWKQCRIRQSPHVHFWQGGDKCPLPEGLKVKSHSRGGSDTITTHYRGLRWEHAGTSGDIIAFEILGTAPGWRYEWEKE